MKKEKLYWNMKNITHHNTEHDQQNAFTLSPLTELTRHGSLAINISILSVRMHTKVFHSILHYNFQGKLRSWNH